MYVFSLQKLIIKLIFWLKRKYFKMYVIQEIIFFAGDYNL